MVISVVKVRFKIINIYDFVAVVTSDNPKSF